VAYIIDDNLYLNFQNMVSQGTIEIYCQQGEVTRWNIDRQHKKKMMIGTASYTSFFVKKFVVGSVMFLCIEDLNKFVKSLRICSLCLNTFVVTRNYVRQYTYATAYDSSKDYRKVEGNTISRIKMDRYGGRLVLYCIHFYSIERIDD
jgi:hypothetical protein